MSEFSRDAEISVKGYPPAAGSGPKKTQSYEVSMIRPRRLDLDALILKALTAHCAGPVSEWQGRVTITIEIPDEPHEVEPDESRHRTTVASRRRRRP